MSNLLTTDQSNLLTTLRTQKGVEPTGIVGRLFGSQILLPLELINFLTIFKFCPTISWFIIASKKT